MFFKHKSDPPPDADLANLKVTDARVGDVLSIAAAAPDFSDLDFTVDRCDGFEAANVRWVELSGPWRDRRVYLEIHHGAVPQVSGNFDGRILTLDELGVSEDDLAEMDNRQNPADFFDYDGKFWLFRSSREITTFPCLGPSAHGFYCWQFQEQDGKRFLSIRKVEGEPFAASIWTQVQPTDITVYRGT